MLFRQELGILYNSPSIRNNRPKGFQTRLSFTIGVLTGIRPTALCSLSASQFKKMKINDNIFWVITKTNGSTEGSSKLQKLDTQQWGEKYQKCMFLMKLMMTERLFSMLILMNICL